MFFIYFVCTSSTLVHIISTDLEKMKEKEKEKKEALKNDVDFPNKTRNMILAGLFAVSAMMAFAYSSGAIRIQDTSEMSIYDMDEDQEENVS